MDREKDSGRDPVPEPSTWSASALAAETGPLLEPPPETESDELALYAENVAESEEVPADEGDEARPDEPPLGDRVKRILVGPPRSLQDKSLFHRLTLIPFLAWVGLGADGLSSSCYGPDEAYRTLREHTYLAVGLAAMTALTVVVIASAYSRIIREFPHGGGGYVVATKLLGRPAGVVSGCALLVDYVLTIAVSVASAGDALWSFLPKEWLAGKLPTEVVIITLLAVLNVRGVRESVMALLPIFLLFLATHLLALGGGILGHLPELGATAQNVRQGFSHGASSLGLVGMLLLFVHAYSMGGGTYTGLEAVSNGLPIMREPRVQTAQRTMVYMAASLAVTAGGLLVCYLLWGVFPLEGKTMNAAFFERLTAGIPGGTAFVILTLISEGALLVVGAQAGFIDGPRVLANMAIDSWMPRRFSALSDRLTTQNGILLMGAASLLVLFYTRGDVRHLVVMYSINVFLTFSLSMFGMARNTIRTRARRDHWKRQAGLFVFGFLLCASILVITTLEKFTEGGWITLLVTSTLVALCFLIQRHYRRLGAKLRKLFAELESIPTAGERVAPPLDPTQPTAALLVGGYGGLGIHALLAAWRAFPGHFKNVVFLSVGVLDSGEFKGEGAVDAIRERTRGDLEKYVELAERLGIAATYRLGVGIDAVDEAEKLCLQVAEQFPQTTYFAGKVIFHRERWYDRILHNETAFAIQKRLQWDNKTMVVLPARVH
jgi:amino acid transporter